MRDRDLQHPDITAAERTGYRRSRYRPRVFTTCDWCGRNINESDEYYYIHGEIICCDCKIECTRTENRRFCDWCGKTILDGDEYFDVHGEILCDECMSDCKRYAEAE